MYNVHLNIKKVVWGYLLICLSHFFAPKGKTALFGAECSRKDAVEGHGFLSASKKFTDSEATLCLWRQSAHLLIFPLRSVCLGHPAQLPVYEGFQQYRLRVSAYCLMCISELKVCLSYVDDCLYVLITITPYCCIYFHVSCVQCTYM